MKTHKRKKSTRDKGSKTVRWGARKKQKKTGHRGGIGMAGSGKRADQKKTLVLKLYGNEYFGKQGITSRKTKRDMRLRINLRQINSNIENYIKKGIAKQTANGVEINLENYKILGDGEVNKKMIIKASEASESAAAKVKKAGGEIQTSKKEE
ncbi:uL15 family ribosomal protein [Candidatus Pacearchaeota archaeon]|nr:uL15 family ribosomal protein [Candidatus Pacearchaeota archaeon]